MKIHLPATKKARIEMLPLIDIVFLLLVFFIYAMLSMAVHRGLPVELPLSTTAEIDKNRRSGRSDLCGQRARCPCGSNPGPAKQSRRHPGTRGAGFCGPRVAVPDDI